MVKMANVLDDSFTELIQLEDKVQQAVSGTKNLTQTYQGVWSQVGNLTQQVHTLERTLLYMQGQMGVRTRGARNIVPPSRLIEEI